MSRLGFDTLQGGAEFQWDIGKQLYGVWNTLKNEGDLKKCNIIDLSHLSMVLFELVHLEAVVLDAKKEMLNIYGMDQADQRVMLIQLACSYVEKHHPGSFARLLQRSQPLDLPQKHQLYASWMADLEFDWAAEVKSWLSSRSVDVVVAVAMFSLIALQTDNRAKRYVNEFPSVAYSIQERFRKWENHVIPV